jgi:hypothetical protein
MTRQPRTRQPVVPGELDLEPIRTLLQTALEVEHAVIPPYLTAWLSIRSGTNAAAAEVVRTVLLEEMLHLTLVANIMNAVGGQPRLTDAGFVPAYPHRLPHTSARFDVAIEKFSPAAIDTFLKIELPEKKQAPPQADRFATLGQFYNAVEQQLIAVCEAHGETRVFCGRRERQVTPAMYYGSGKLVEVFNLATACQALDEIVEQGEGCRGGIFDADPAIDGSEGREPAHYYRFMEIRRGRRYRKGDRPDAPSGAPLPVDFTAVYPMRANTRLGDYSPGSPIRGALQAFADTYGELLASLEDAFNGNPSRVAQAVHVMFTLKYQAQALLRTPSGRKDGETVGLTFEQTGSRSKRKLSAPKATAAAPADHTSTGAAADPYPDVDRAIVAHAHEFKKPGVLTVRPGYKTIDGRVTPQPAVVVTMRHKPDTAVSPIPPLVGGYPTDVRQASALKVKRVTDPKTFAKESGPHHGVVEHPYERDAQTGQPLAPMPRHPALQKKIKVPYTAPKGVSLGPVKGQMSIVCHASPDAGFMQLKSFLSNVKSQLTVGMYDFGSQPILEAFLKGLGKTQKVSFVLDRPFSENPSANQSDDQTHAAIAKALGKRLTFSWAAEAADQMVDGWVFPTAYHIKVAVRDHQTFWLSSGNWNPSNQPAIDPFDKSMTAAQREQMLRIVQRSDRDWHVIITHAGLAKTFEAYLLHDQQVASKLQAKVTPKPQTAPQQAQAAAEANWTPTFKPLTIEGNILVHPLLTPDPGDGNYVKAMLELIQSARKTLYIQTQYIELPSRPETVPGVKALIDAVQARIKAGLDVRIIVSEWETAAHADYLEVLQHDGFDISKMRIQTGVHNKGFLVDSKVVAVGSQNWSSEGVLQNRDATVIIHDARAAKYFEGIFLHDWTTLAKPATAPAVHAAPAHVG